MVVYSHTTWAALIWKNKFSLFHLESHCKTPPPGPSEHTENTYEKGNHVKTWTLTIFLALLFLIRFAGGLQADHDCKAMHDSLLCFSCKLWHFCRHNHRLEEPLLAAPERRAHTHAPSFLVAALVEHLSQERNVVQRLP